MNHKKAIIQLLEEIIKDLKEEEHELRQRRGEYEKRLQRALLLKEEIDG